MFGLSKVVVAGSSMSPAFNQGDWLIVRKLSGQKHRLKIGKLYLITDPERPGVALLKRLKHTRMEHGVMRYWVEGDNPASTDSKSWGWIESEQFLGKVLFRYKRG
ncbi:MAG: S26 family signal peptidase [Candidatus Nanopelagicus sp.]|jgi:nickel-type superoxide dismutase maturation protease